MQFGAVLLVVLIAEAKMAQFQNLIFSLQDRVVIFLFKHKPVFSIHS